MTPARWSRRQALGALGAAGCVATLGLGGACGSSRGRDLEVAVIWSGAELSRFREVVDRYPRPVNVVSAGDDIDGFLRTRRAAGNSPDVAVLPRPGLLAEYARNGWIAPLRGSFPAERFDDWWNALVTVPDDAGRCRLFGAWVKAAHKSLVWHLRSGLAAPPTTWAELREMVEARARRDGDEPAPLAIGADDGWVLTDWFENVLASRGSAGLHDRLARGEKEWTDEAVVGALEDLAEVWRVPGAFPGGPGRAALTQHGEAVAQVVGSRQASMVMAPDFARTTVDEHLAGGDVRTFRVPSSTGILPLVVGGDCAAVLRDEGRGERELQHAHDLVEWLVGSDAFDPWIEHGGYLTPNTEVRREQYRRAGRDIEAFRLSEVQSPGRGHRFDLSDRLPADMGGAPGRGMWDVLQTMFAAVAGVGSGRAADRTVEAAIDEVVARMDEAAPGLEAGTTRLGAEGCR